MATTVDAVRFVAGYWASYPEIIQGCDMDESIASAVNMFVEHGWKALIEAWDVDAAEAFVLVDAGKYRTGLVDNPYDKPVVQAAGPRQMTSQDFRISEAERNELAKRLTELYDKKYSFNARIRGVPDKDSAEREEINEILRLDAVARGWM